METELCLVVMLSEAHWDASSAGPDLHVFYSDGKSEQTWTRRGAVKKTGFFLFRSKGGGGLGQSKKSLSENTQIFLSNFDQFLTNHDQFRPIFDQF